MDSAMTWQRSLLLACLFVVGAPSALMAAEDEGGGESEDGGSEGGSEDSGSEGGAGDTAPSTDEGEAPAPSSDGGEDGGGEAEPSSRGRSKRGGDDESADAKAERSRSSGRSTADRVDRKKRVVKVIQKRFFMKSGRLEILPQFVYVGNDHFIRRIGAGLDLDIHINDLLAIEIDLSYMPDLGESDYKALTRQFQYEQQVVPDISRLMFLGAVNAQISPIFGKVELGTLRVINYDIYFSAGFGVGYSRDDTAIVHSPCDEFETVADRKANVDLGCDYVDQMHPVTNFGGGLRVVFNDWIGVRLDARQYTHIEQVYREAEADVGLEMKQNFMVSIGASIWLPAIKAPAAE